MEQTKANLCQIPELGLSCVGCCGAGLKDKEQVLEGIKKNTKDLSEHSSVRDFINRAKPEDLRKSGICRNITFIGFDEKRKDVIIGCPAHPEFRDDIADHRKGHCNIHHLCRIAGVFDYWEENKQKKFLDFLKKKAEEGMDWFEYSVKMDNDEMLKEFEGFYESLLSKKRNILKRPDVIKV